MDALVAFIAGPRTGSSLLVAAALLAPIALRPSISFVALVGLVTIAILFGQSYRGMNLLPRSAAFVGVISFMSVIASTAMWSSALSSPRDAIASMSFITISSAVCALVSIWTAADILGARTPHVQIFAFPAMWATANVMIAHVSPIGRLSAWTPSTGMEGYYWIVPLLGVAGLDYIVGLSSMTLALMFGSWIMDYEGDMLAEPEYCDEVPPTGTLSTLSRRVEARNVLRLIPCLLVLLGLCIPGYFTPSPPEDLTTLSVACILPPPPLFEVLEPENYVRETAREAAFSKLLLWPEGVAVFEDKAQHNKTLVAVSALAKQYKVWIGMSYRERSGNRYWNAVSLVGPDGVIGEYRKRNIVPVAESYSTHSSAAAPAILSIPLLPPKGFPADKWSPSIPRVRNVTVAFSICLDLSVPLPILSERPALLLAPSQTFHPSVGEAMYNQAKLRAMELGTSMVWCDGGKGGSGIVDRTTASEAWTGNVKGRSFRWDVRIPWPNDPSRTLYGSAGPLLGDLRALMIFWLIVLLTSFYSNIWDLYLAVRTGPADHFVGEPQAPTENSRLIEV